MIVVIAVIGVCCFSIQLVTKQWCNKACWGRRSQIANSIGVRSFILTNKTNTNSSYSSIYIQMLFISSKFVLASHDCASPAPSAVTSQLLALLTEVAQVGLAGVIVLLI